MPKSGEYQDDPPKQRSRIAEYLGTADFWTALATIFLVIVGIWGVIETKHALKLSERAWISVIGAGLRAPPEEGKVIQFNAILINFGKQPGISTDYAVQHGTVKAPPPEDWTSLSVERNNTCEGLHPKAGAQAIMPALNALGIVRGFDSGNGRDPMTASKAIIDGVFHYYVRGCVAYETFEEPHISSFCYVLKTQAGVAWDKTPFVACNTGFEAN
jgi:hypothetical protein